MSSEPKGSKAAKGLEVIEPVGKRVLLRKDEDKKQTKTGIHLPDKIEIPTLTGRVVAVSAEVERNDDYPIKKYDRILFNPKHAIPVEFDGDNRLVRLIFSGTTGDSRKLAALLTSLYKFQPRKTNDPRLFLSQVDDGDRAVSELRVWPDDVVTADDLVPRFDISAVPAAPWSLAATDL